MDIPSEMKEFLNNRSAVIHYLRTGEGDYRWMDLLGENEVARDHFHRELEKRAEADIEVSRAMDRALEREEAALENLFYQVVDHQLEEENWSEEASIGRVLEMWREEDSSPPVIGIVDRSQLPAAAGGIDDLPSLPGELLREFGLPGEMAILCRRVEGGYELRLDSSTPLRLTLIFFRGEEELYRCEVSEQLPEEIIPVDAIRNWTHLQLERVD